jgi:excisionase family DNA binding protein
LTEEERDAADTWLTLAEIAQELRVNPATVRQWVSRGQLKASRAGVRKWIVRRSDLQRMLGATNSDGIDSGDAAGADSPPFRAEARARPEQEQSAPGYVGADATRENAAKLVQYASRSLDDAFAASAFALPSPGYLDRIRAIAEGFEQLSAAITHASRAARLRWPGGGAFGRDDIPYELRPGGNRPFREGLWDEFDAAVDTLAIALTGDDMPTLADSLREVGEALRVVAEELERDGAWQVGYDAA